MSRVGGQRAVHFPPRLDNPQTRASSDADSIENPLVAYGHLVKDHDILRAMLKILHADESGMHGNLQVMKGALVRMSQRVDQLIKGLEV